MDTGQLRQDETSLAWLPLFLQTGDALFPTGAYAHSLGFEELVRLGVVHHEASLTAFLCEQTLPALAHQELPYLRWAIQAAESADVAELCALDMEIGAWKLPLESRTASAQLGLRRLAALRGILPGEVLSCFAERVAAGAAQGHHLTVYGLQAAAGGIPLKAALAAYGYHSLAGLCGAALKLIRIGQEGCQRALRHGSAGLPECVETSLRVERDAAGWFNPQLEIASMRHEFAEERLFIS